MKCKLQQCRVRSEHLDEQHYGGCAFAGTEGPVLLPGPLKPELSSEAGT